MINKKINTIPLTLTSTHRQLAKTVQNEGWSIMPFVMEGWILIHYLKENVI